MTNTNEIAGNCRNCGRELAWVRHANGGAGLRHTAHGGLMCEPGSYVSAAIAPALCGSSAPHAAHSLRRALESRAQEEIQQTT